MTPIDFDQFQARVSNTRGNLGLCIGDLHHATEVLNNAYWRDYLDPNLGDFRPDLEDWMRQQLGEVLSAAANLSTAMGISLGAVAMRSVTCEP